MGENSEWVTPGEVLGKASKFKAGRGAYVSPDKLTVYASLTGSRRILSPPSDSPDQRPTVEVTGHKAHGAIPEPGSVVIARVTKVMERMASADILCLGTKSVREKFSGIIRLQDVRATEIDKVDMLSSFRLGDIVRAHVVSFVWNAPLSLGDARAYYLSTAKNELGVISAQSAASGETMVPISWTEMQCPRTGQIEQRKVAKMVDSLLLLPAFSLLVIVFSMAINVVPSEAAAYDRVADCPVSNCSDAGPLIKFPFRLKDHPLQCGHPEFEVSCLKNKTMIQLSSSSGLFPIQSVNYRRRTFSVYDDEGGCFPRRLLNFTISTTSLFEPIPSQEPIPSSDPRMVNSGMYSSRFNCADHSISPSYLPYLYGPHPYGMRYPQFINVTLLNCSTTQKLNTGSSYIPITCLSVGHHQVLAVSPSASVTELPFRTCSTLKQLDLPLRRVDDGNSTGYHCEPGNVLRLKWKLNSYFPQCQNCTEGTGSCEFNDTSNRMECHPYPIVRDPPQALPFPKAPKPKGCLSTRRSIIVGASLASFRPTVEVTGHKAHGAIPEPGSVVIARVTKVMERMASADILCLGTKSVREEFSGIIRYAVLLMKNDYIGIAFISCIFGLQLQDVRATEIDKVDMLSSFRPGETMVPISWTEMQCPRTGQIEQRKVAKVGG
ncbi:hypothetical protein DVH24_036856 [Malus domestica]|uniref:S1 motif domain-containing protein n=1 Tax=Malus domestica TaxID=3750 RepID=A0A498IK43_MALDO|nr:hypothetical protein DVH24_036856 [Malus domestica]